MLLYLEGKDHEMSILSRKARGLVYSLTLVA